MADISTLPMAAPRCSGRFTVRLLSRTNCTVGKLLIPQLITKSRAPAGTTHRPSATEATAGTSALQAVLRPTVLQTVRGPHHTARPTTVTTSRWTAVPAHVTTV